MVRSLFVLLVASVSLRAAEIPDTLVVDGQTYKGVAYQSHDASRLKITHETGVASLLIASLPSELRVKLGFDEKAAAEAESVFQRQQEQARARASLAPQADHKRKELLAWKLRDMAIPVVGQIFQVVPNGILMNSLVLTTGVVTNEVSEENLLHPERTKLVREKGTVTKQIGPSEVVYVATDTSGLVDAGQYAGTIFSIGTHSYATASGSMSTLPAFTDNPEVAAKFHGVE